MGIDDFDDDFDDLDVPRKNKNRLEEIEGPIDPFPDVIYPLYNEDDDEEVEITDFNEEIPDIEITDFDDDIRSIDLGDMMDDLKKGNQDDDNDILRM